MSWLTEHQRLIGRCAWVAAWVGLVVGQLHALSRFATTEGAEDLALPATAAWAVPAAEALSPLLGWGDADLVYVSYGSLGPLGVGHARNLERRHSMTLAVMSHSGSRNSSAAHPIGGISRTAIPRAAGATSGNSHTGTRHRAARPLEVGRCDVWLCRHDQSSCRCCRPRRVFCWNVHGQSRTRCRCLGSRARPRSRDAVKRATRSGSAQSKVTCTA
jgi:hypothetical protein